MRDSRKSAVNKCITSRVVIDEIGVAKNKVDSLADFLSSHITTSNMEIIKRLNDISDSLKQRSMKAKFKQTVNESALVDLLKDGSSFKSNGYSISDHAFMRYMERAIGVDMKELTNTMISEIDSDNIPTGNGVYRVNNTKKDVKYLMNGKVIVTVLDN
jgi:hypothetical protein